MQWICLNKRCYSSNRNSTEQVSCSREMQVTFVRRNCVANKVQLWENMIIYSFQKIKLLNDCYFLKLFKNIGTSLWVSSSCYGQSLRGIFKYILQCIVCFLCFRFVLSGLVRISSYWKLIRPTEHATSRHGTPSLTSLSKDNEVSYEVRPRGYPSRAWPHSTKLNFSHLTKTV